MMTADISSHRIGLLHLDIFQDWTQQRVNCLKQSTWYLDAPLFTEGLSLKILVRARASFLTDLSVDL